MPSYCSQSDLKICKTKVDTQKINNSTLKTQRIVISIFSMLNKDDRGRFFEKSFLLADVKPDIVTKMPFLIISNVDIDFQSQDF